MQAPSEKLSKSFYIELDKIIRSDSGAGMILHYLQNLDLDGFNPKGEALHTPWRDEVIGLSRDSLEEFKANIIEDPSMIFMAGGNLPDLQLFRAEDILRQFEIKYPKYRFNVTVSRMGKMLNDARLEKRHVRVSSDSSLLTLYALFKPEKWGDKTNKEWATHYEQNAKVFGNRSRH
jgi:hypothetical protein